MAKRQNKVRELGSDFEKTSKNQQSCFEKPWKKENFICMGQTIRIQTRFFEKAPFLLKFQQKWVASFFNREIKIHRTRFSKPAELETFGNISSKKFCEKFCQFSFFKTIPFFDEWSRIQTFAKEKNASKETSFKKIETRKSSKKKKKTFLPSSRLFEISSLRFVFKQTSSDGFLKKFREIGAGSDFGRCTCWS